MGTKKETTSNSTQTTTNAYNPAAMSQFNLLQPAIGANLLRGMNSDALRNMFMQQANIGIGQIGNRMNSNLFANARTSGFQLNNPFMQAALARNNRAIGGMQGNAFLNSLFQSEDLKRAYTGMAMGYQPLQTGGTTNAKSHSIEQTSGLGTWLPQVIGAGVSGAMGLATGGASFLGSAMPFMSGGAPSAMAGVTGAVPGGFAPLPNSFWAQPASIPSFGGGH